MPRWKNGVIVEEIKDINASSEAKDGIDFKNAPIRPLFRKLFYPTLMGMLSMVVVNLADGAFVGHGAGSDALAAINIASPIFTLMTGIGITLGIGSSILASIHLSRGNAKAANLHLTQALVGSLFFTLLLSGLLLSNLPLTCRLFGSDESLIPLASRYLMWVCLFMPLNTLGMVGSFAVRLDGSPKYAMCCTLIASVLNIVLDWLFVYPLHMGLEGAAIATSLSFGVSAVVTLFYLFFLTKNIKIKRLRFTLKVLKQTARNVAEQIKAGLPAMLGEVAISGMIIVGNFVFIKYLGPDGVAAFSVACYCTPIFFMLANAIVEASQPMISFAYGSSQLKRLSSIRRMILLYALGAGVLSTAVLVFGAYPVTHIFLTPDAPAFGLCMSGLPLFGISAFFVPLNLVIIGYLQSMERGTAATLFTVLRGFVLMIPSFLLLPMAIGVPGIWLAAPLSEALTFLILCVVL